MIIHKNIHTLSLTLLAIASASYAAHSNAQVTHTWNAGSDFSAPTPTAPWSYLQRVGSSCGNASTALAPSYNPAAGISGYILGAIPLVAKNTSSSAVNGLGGSVNIAPGVLWMHPGQNGECAVIRFTTPMAGKFTVTVTLSSIDYVAPNTVRGFVYADNVLQGGAEVLNSANVVNTSKTFTRTVTLLPHKAIDIALDDGGSGNQPFRFDSTKVSIDIKREPRKKGDDGQPGTGTGSDNPIASGTQTFAGDTDMATGPKGGPKDDPRNEDGDLPALDCSKQPGKILDLSTGVATWKHAGSNAPVITPYQYWSQQVGSSTLTPMAKWINSNASNLSAGPAHYVFKTKFRVLKCGNNKPAKLDAIFLGDNDVSLKLNGTQIAQNVLAANYGFMDGHQGTVTSMALPPGVHVLEMDLYNQGSYSGFIMKAKASR